MSLMWESAPEERDADYPEITPVRLQHLNVDCYWVVHEPGLFDRLEHSGKEIIPVEFELTSGVGGRHAGLAWSRIVSIDGLEYRAGAYSRVDHGGCRGKDGQDPFREFYE